MCLNVWKCVGVGIIEDGSVLWFSLWDLISTFESTVVVITDFLYWEIYISIFIYQFLITWIGYDIFHDIFTGFKSTIDKWLLFFTHFPLALFAEGAFHIYKENNGRFIHYCFLHTYHFAGYDNTLDQMQLVQAVLCNMNDLWGGNGSSKTFGNFNYLAYLWAVCQ